MWIQHEPETTRACKASANTSIIKHSYRQLVTFMWISVLAGSLPRDGAVAVYVSDINQPSLSTLFFLFCSYVYLCFLWPLNCISLQKFSRQLSAFSLSSSGLISAFLVLSTKYLFTKVSFSPDVILCGWLGLKHQLINYADLGLPVLIALFCHAILNFVLCHHLLWFVYILDLFVSALYPSFGWR